MSYDVICDKCFNDLLGIAFFKMYLSPHNYKIKLIKMEKLKIYGEQLQDHKFYTFPYKLKY